MQFPTNRSIPQSAANARQLKGNERFSPSPSMTTVSGPRYGTTVPNRIFVGGITTDTVESELQNLFLQFGNVKGVKIINDRAGVPKGYGFVTFETDEEARRVLSESENLTLKGRKLNVAIAVKKQSIGRPLDAQFIPNGAIVYPNAIPIPYVNDSSAHFTFSADTFYQFNGGPSAGTMANTYPVIYHQHPIFVAQPQAAPALNAYPNTHFPTATTNATGSYPATHFQAGAAPPTPQWAAFVNPGQWQWPAAGGECISYINMNPVALNK
ncbi:protein boule-like protein [Leptotrombidium deliense]|uniref:Protein boule-like protein n=1 Tax=Leptotrombidium deliense TaxID=299467 RepID=A0A443SVI8_9ACAR|nr:protein boule-like protein [Leptotrombidium deliense]